VRTPPPLVALLLALACGSARAQVHYHDDGRPWSQKARGGPDAAAGGWYYNLGLTGMRAMLLQDQPERLLVKYVFEGTPAAGRVRAGDLVVGANGRPFVTPHRNGYGIPVFGGDGPLKDFGVALEESQLKGTLSLDLLRDGKPVSVKLDVGTRYGVYGKTFPDDCPKSERVLKELLAFLEESQKDDGSWGAPHTNTFAALALLAARTPERLARVKKAVEFHARTTKDVDQGSLIHWRYMAAGIVMSEYYLATKEAWVLPELKEVYDFLHGTQYVSPSQVGESARKRGLPKREDQALGGWGHNPGFEGYGPIAMVTGQGALVYALLRRCGIPVSRARHELAYDFLARGTGRNGYVWYADGVSKHDGWADMGRTGAAGLANHLSPYKDGPYADRALAHARVIGEHPETLPDTHGSPLMGMGYTALAARVDPASFRKMMDANRWWFTLAQCPDGTFYYQPNRDNYPMDFSGGSRVPATALVALVFAAKPGTLRLTGKTRD
jgi:hypothetical protein